MGISRKERKIIIIILAIAITVTLLLPLLSHMYFLANTYTKFYKPFPSEQFSKIEYEIRFDHISHGILAFTGIPLSFSVPSIHSYYAYLTEPYKSYGHSLIPFLILKWIPWFSIPISYKFTKGIVRWRRGLYIYLIATYLGVLNMSILLGGSVFDMLLSNL